MKQLVFLLLTIAYCYAASAQDRLLSRNGSISFYSKTPLEDIEANTQTAVSVLVEKTGQIEFSVLMKSFTFEKALMQEHFNEDYLESDKFPKSTFKGQVDDLSKVSFDKDGRYTATVTGELTIHGQSRTLTTPVMFTILKGVALADAEFDVALSDYKIEIPSLAKDKISKTVKITVRIKYETQALP